MRVRRGTHIFLIALCAAVAALVACPPPADPEPEEPTIPEPTAEPEPEPEDVDEPEEVVVEMTATRFQPAEIEVEVGRTVIWHNTSGVVHTVTADPEMATDPENVELPEGAETFHSGNIASGTEYRREFTVSGTYRYVCLPHEAMGMVGTITVLEANEEEE